MQQTQTRCQTVTDHPESNESLCVRVQQGDAQAKLQLLKQNEGMIHTIAWRERRRYAYLSLELEDLWAAGQMGLLPAGRLYRPENGNRFATYAWSHIRQAVQKRKTARPSMRLRSGRSFARSSLWSRCAV